MRLVAGFYHLCQRGSWRSIYAAHARAVRESGLADAVEAVYMTVLGDEPVEVEPPFVLSYRSPNQGEWEFPALALAHAWACLHPAGAVQYAHSKGVMNRKPSTAPWREYMTWGTVERWRDCLEALESGYDTAGVEWHEGGWPRGNPRPRVDVRTGFYAGNFWWANSTYLRALPSPAMLETGNRWECEAWLGKAPAIRPAELHHLGIPEHRDGAGGVFAPGFDASAYRAAQAAPRPPAPVGRGFYLVCQRGEHWRDIVAEQVARAEASGILDALDTVETVVLGDEPVDLPSPFALVHRGTPSEYEWPAIERMSAWARTHPGELAAYWHTKGVSHQGDPYAEWRRYINWAVLDRWRDCVARLRDGYDTAGVDWLCQPHLTPRGGTPGAKPEVNYHTGSIGCWPGSTFWATSNHLARLPSPASMDRENRWACEAWIGMHPDTRYTELHRVAPHNGGWFTDSFDATWYDGPRARPPARPKSPPKWIPAAERQHRPAPPPAGLPIVIYLHCACLGEWRAIHAEILDAAARAGLLDHAEAVRTALVCRRRANAVEMRPGEELLYRESRTAWEMPTLERLRMEASGREPFRALYLHSKGVTRRGAHAADWRRCMLHWLVERWRDCLDLLDAGADTVGICWTRGTGPMAGDPHYSGNFWWANSTYLRSLPSLASSTDRYDAERWIGRGNPRAACVYRPGVVWNPHHPHPRELYAHLPFEDQSSCESTATP